MKKNLPEVGLGFSFLFPPWARAKKHKKYKNKKKKWRRTSALCLLWWFWAGRPRRGRSETTKYEKKFAVNILQGKFSVCNKILYKKDFISKSLRNPTNYVLQYSECLNVWQQASHGRLVTVFWLSKLFIKFDFSLRRFRRKKTTSSVAMIFIKFFNSVWDSKTVLTRKTSKGRMNDTQFNFSNMFSGCQVGQAFVTFIFSWIKLCLL